jgi:hypothetical protein
MPDWTLDELLLVAKEENMDAAMVKENYDKFKGIIRYTLATNRLVLAEQLINLDDRCNKVRASVLRSPNTTIDEEGMFLGDSQNLSGFVACHANIPEYGESAFTTYSLEMTSAYANWKVLVNLGLISVQEAVESLTKNLRLKPSERTDRLGKDLELAVVNFLSFGDGELPWQYYPIDTDLRKDKELINAKPLQLGPKEIMRNLTDSSETHLCYPSSSTFGLVDCYTMQDKVSFAFQISWQESHQFKLSTLWKFRQIAKIGTAGTLNIYFVNPTAADMYAKRSKDKYLEKAQRLDADIEDCRGKLVLTKEEVAEMWENTHIFCAFPEGNQWPKAIRKWYGVAGFRRPHDDFETTPENKDNVKEMKKTRKTKKNYTIVES